MSWFNLALLLLRIADKIADIVREKGQMDSGRDRAIAEQAVVILAKTSSAREVWTEVTGMTDDQINRALKELEP